MVGQSESSVCCYRDAVALPIFPSQHTRVRALTNQYPAAEAPWSLQVLDQYFDRDIYLPEYNLREVLTVSTQPVDSSTQWSAS